MPRRSGKSSIAPAQQSMVAVEQTAVTEAIRVNKASRRSSKKQRTDAIPAVSPIKIAHETESRTMVSSFVGIVITVATPSAPYITYRVNEWNHRVYVDTSRIPNGGQGLFAKVPIKKGEIICTYGGKLIDPAEARYLDPTYIAAFEPGKGFKLQGDNQAGDLGHYANSIAPDFEDLDANGVPEKSSNKRNKLVSGGEEKTKANKKVKVADQENISSMANTTTSSSTTSSSSLVAHSPTNSSVSSGDVTLLERSRLPPVHQNAKFNFTTKRYVDNKTRGRFDLVATADIEVDMEIIVNYGVGYWSTMSKFWNKEVPIKPQTAINRDLRAQRRGEQKMHNHSTSMISAVEADLIAAIPERVVETKPTAESNNATKVVVKGSKRGRKPKSENTIVVHASDSTVPESSSEPGAQKIKRNKRKRST